ncbi:MAG: hypothetical protein K8S16_21775 [Bacteroidales bacterium]|nr:hypothetical protein [Bacteroidales bacterium]
MQRRKVFISSVQVEFAKKAKLQEPVFIQEDSFRTIVYRPQTKQVTPEVTPEVIKMLRIIEGEMMRSEIMAKLGLKDEKHFREYYQQVCIELGLIEMTIPNKPRSSKQKYRLTEKGLEVKKE